MDALSLILLLLTGVVALIMAVFLFLDYFKNKKLFHLWWAISMLVLFLSGILFVITDYAILADPLIPIVATIIPVGLAVGLLYAVMPDKSYGLYYTIYSVLLIIVQAAGRYITGLEAIALPTLLAVHIPSGLIIVFLPVLTAIRKETEFTSIFFSLGGVAISLGGMLLAFVKINSPLLPLTTILAILPILLLLVGVLYFIGIFMPTKWKATLPIGK
ncbi:MAG: hypothetical protein ACTSYL_07740 [Candidatus Thorarchaeota archaeon]